MPVVRVLLLVVLVADVFDIVIVTPDPGECCNANGQTIDVIDTPPRNRVRTVTNRLETGVETVAKHRRNYGNTFEDENFTKKHNEPGMEYNYFSSIAVYY